MSKFKVGQRIRLTNNVMPGKKGDEGVIIQLVSRKNSTFPIRAKIDNYQSIFFLSEGEIELVTSKLDKARSKQDVYHSLGGQTFVQTHDLAEKNGYQFFTNKTYADMDVYYRVGDKDGHEKISGFLTLPETHEENTVTIETKVLEFLNDPNRSDRNKLYTTLGNREFFGATEERQREILNHLLQGDGFCEQGKQRFRDHMGDLLDEPDPYKDFKNRDVKATITFAQFAASSAQTMVHRINKILDEDGTYSVRLIITEEK